MIRNRRATLKIYGTIVFLLCAVIILLHVRQQDDPINSFLLFMKKGFHFLTRISVGDVYLYSAIANPDVHWKTFSSITINVWDDSQNKNFKCCIFNKNSPSEPHVSHAQIKNDFGYAALQARQYQCLFPSAFTNATHVGMVESSKPCIPYMTTIPIIYPTQETGKIAVCAKIAYGTLSAQRLIEWFEYQRLMGVDKVLIMVQYLDDDSYEVLQHYQKSGFAEIDDFPSPLPGYVIGHPDRGFEESRFTLPQCSHDKQVGVYHCQEKLQGYQFVAIIDFDEYIVHDDFLPYKEFLQRELMTKYPDAAGFTFNVSFFILDWGATGNDDLFLTKYVQRTEPREECFKNIYLPSRIKAVTTHTFEAKPEFKRYFLSSDNVVMHHYRECPKVPQWKDCMEKPRTIDLKMHQIKDEMTKRVKRVQNILKHSSVN